MQGWGLVSSGPRFLPMMRFMVYINGLSASTRYPRLRQATRKAKRLVHCGAVEVWGWNSEGGKSHRYWP